LDRTATCFAGSPPASNSRRRSIVAVANLQSRPIADGKLVKFQGAGDTALQERIWGRK